LFFFLEANNLPLGRMFVKVERMRQGCENKMGWGNKSFKHPSNSQSPLNLCLAVAELAGV
jgi:hypothetical protein